METSCGAASGLESHLGYWLRRVSNFVSGSFEQALTEQQTSVAEWVLLRRLCDRGEATPGEMAAALALTRGAVSKIIDKLEAKTWITSKAAPSDGRAQLLSLTRAGQKAVPLLAGIADANDERFFGRLSGKERKTLRKLLIKLSESNQINHIPVD